jgi:hypothetical protein
MIVSSDAQRGAVKMIAEKFFNMKYVEGMS